MGGIGWSWAFLGCLGAVLGGPGVVLADLAGSKGGLGRVLGESWGGLGGSLGGLGGVLGSDLGLSWGILGPLAGVLGRLGGILVPFSRGWYFVTDFHWILRKSFDKSNTWKRLLVLQK